MAVGWSMPEHSWSPGALPEAERSGREFGPEGALDLALVRAAIQDGLLMVFGPDGDPLPRQVFGAAAAEQPDAGVRLADGPLVRAERIAAVLDAQMRGQLGSAHGGGEAWIRAMLGDGPEPETARSEDLLTEDCTVEVVPFGRELMLTTSNHATFLIAAARSRTPVSLRLAGEGPVALGDLVARLLAGTDRNHRSPSSDEFAAPACKAWLEGDALRIDLPEVGTVDLVRADDDALAAAPSVSLFMANGEVATLDDLLSALGTPIAPPARTGHGDPLDPPLPRATPPTGKRRCRLRSACRTRSPPSPAWRSSWCMACPRGSNCRPASKAAMAAGCFRLGTCPNCP